MTTLSIGIQDSLHSSHCVGHYDTVPFGVSMHSTCGNCLRRIEHPFDAAKSWMTVATVNETCIYKIAREV